MLRLGGLVFLPWLELRSVERTLNCYSLCDSRHFELSLGLSSCAPSSLLFPELVFVLCSASRHTYHVFLALVELLLASRL